VYAFEPEFHSFKLGKINAILNGVDGRISSHQLAVGGKTERIYLYESIENWGHTTSIDGGPHNILSGNKIHVNCLSLEDTLNYANCVECDFLKFNIEGAEFSLFSSADLDTLRRIKCMVGEVHFDLVKQNTDELVIKLQNAGFLVRLDFFTDCRAILFAKRN